MKLSKIAALCKETGVIRIYDGVEGVQYVSDGRVVFPMHGLPRVNEENIANVLDIPFDKQKEYSIMREELSKFPYSLEDNETGDSEPLTETKLALAVNGKALQPVYTHKGVVLFDKRLLDPIKDESSITLHLRGNVLVAKAGFQLRALFGKWWESTDTLDKYADELCDVSEALVGMMANRGPDDVGIAPYGEREKA